MLWCALAILCGAVPQHGSWGDLELPGFTPLVHAEAGDAARTPPTDAAIAVARGRRGVWPIANGRVFAYTGYGEPANRLFMITGPQYQTRGNHEVHGMFGEHWIEVLEDGVVAGVVQRRWSRIARAAATRTVERTDSGHRLEITDVALADEPVLLRRIRWTRATDFAGTLRLAFRFDEHPDRARPAGDTLHKSYPKGDDEFRMAARLLRAPAPAVVESGAITIGLERRTHADLTFAIVTSRSETDEARLLHRLSASDPAQLVAEALRAWRATLDRTVTAHPDSAIRRTLESVKTAILAQRSVPHGAVAPMVSFKGVWLRDSIGPIRALLWMGKYPEVRRILRYYRRASVLARRTAREFPLDLPVTANTALAPAEWRETATDRVEVPSYVVLQHLWYYHATGDAELIREAWPYLRRNALHQEVHEGPHGPLQKFNGDETYLHGAFYSLFPGRDVWPNHFPRASAYSLDSMLTFVAAQRAMLELGEVAGETEDRPEFERRAAAMEQSIDAHFWLADEQRWAPAISPLDHTPHRAPYGPINLRPLWLGTHKGPRATANLLSTMALLGRPNGLIKMTPSVDRFIGCLPGYYLVNLAAVDHPAAGRTFEALLASSSVAGSWAEVHEPDRPGHGYGSGVYPNRLRPWESGLNFDAMLRFLTGASIRHGREAVFRPRRPPTIELERLGPIPVGDARLTLHYGAAREPVRIDHIGGPAITVNGRALAAGESVSVPLARPAELPTPEPATFDARLDVPAATALVLTAKPRPRRDRERILDVGLPFAPDDLREVLFDGDRLRFERVVIDPSATEADRETMKPRRFWVALEPLLRRFEAAGGEVVR